MNDVRLISVDDLKQVTSISATIETDLLEPYLELSEELYCVEILGEALTSELRNQITGNTITEVNQYLLTKYIKPLVSYGAWEQYVPFNAIKSTQIGEIRQTTDNSSSADLPEVTFKRQALKDKISYYQKRLRDYLDKNKNNYPLYRSSCSPSTGNSWSIYLGKSN